MEDLNLSGWCLSQNLMKSRGKSNTIIQLYNNAVDRSVNNYIHIGVYNNMIICNINT